MKIGPQKVRRKAPEKSLLNSKTRTSALSRSEIEIFERPLGDSMSGAGDERGRQLNMADVSKLLLHFVKAIGIATTADIADLQGQIDDMNQKWERQIDDWRQQ